MTLTLRSQRLNGHGTICDFDINILMKFYTPLEQPCMCRLLKGSLSFERRLLNDVFSVQIDFIKYIEVQDGKYTDLQLFYSEVKQIFIFSKISFVLRTLISTVH